MSTTIDERILKMQFDNQQFEQNVQTSMSTLDKLKEKLNLSGASEGLSSASKGLDSIAQSAKGVSLVGMINGLDTLSVKFSALQVMGATALANITNTAVNYSKRIMSALTVDPVKTGFSEYETQINAVQTILANTQNKGTTLTDVNAALDQLNTYADKTIYNFTEMTRNIGTFTAAGVDLDSSVSAIQGIANLAAVSGSTSQQASTAMYQLSQALAAGRVNLQDWNSVVNAGMGGQVFQDALKRTAKVMGKDVDGAIAKYGSFRESLSKGEWLTTDVLTKTLEQFTMAAKEGSAEWENYKKSLMAEGYTEKQATEILKMANTATDAATKVKTFTQLWDTLKEAAQSGWTQTWEIIVGDFEEAKSMLTNVSNVINDMIGRSAEARNNLLKGWKDAGGRKDLIDGISNAFQGLMNIITPIGKAFREVFPALKSEQLVSFTKGFKSLTASFEAFTEKHGDNIQAAFKGIFSVIEVGWTFIKKLGSGLVEVVSHLLGFADGILSGAGSIGKFLTNVSGAIKSTDIFGKGVDFVVGILTTGIDKVKSFGSAIKESFEAHRFEGFVNFFKGFWNVIKSVGSGIAKVLAPIGQTIAGLFQNSSLFDVLNSGLLAGSFLGIGKMAGGIEAFNEIFNKLLEKKESGGLMDTIKESLSGLLDVFESYQNNLNAQTFSKIAIAIGVLTAAIFLLSTIDTDSLYASLTAVTVLFGELIGAMKMFDTMGLGLKGAGKAVLFMIGMSTALLILSGAMKSVSGLSWEEIAKGLAGIGGAMAIMIAALNYMPRDTSTTFKTLFKSFKSGSTTNLVSAGIGMIAMAAAIKILASAMKDISSMSLEEIGRGIVGIGGALGAIVLAMKYMPKNDMGNVSGGMVKMGIGMIALAAALKILASAMKDFSTMSYDEIARGFTAMAGALSAITIVVNAMPKNMVGIGVGLIAVSTAMVILASAMEKLGGMTWDEIARGMSVIGGALIMFGVSLQAMTGTLGGSAALLVAVAALALFTPILITLGSLSWQTIVTGLLTIAGAFTVLGVASTVLAPLIPTMLALSGAIALFGVGILALGAGIIAISTGFTALVAAISGGAVAFVAGLTVIVSGILTMIPTVATELAKAIITFVQTIGEGAPKILEALTSIIVSLTKALVEAIPVVVDGLLKLITSLLEALATHMPALLDAATDLIVAFVEGINANLPRLVQAAFDLIINFIDSLATAVEDNAPRLAEAVKHLILSVIKASIALLTAGVDTFKEAGSAIMNSGLVQGIISKASAVITGVGNIIKKAYNAVVSFIGNFLTAGKNLIVKLGTGIKNAASKVKNACVDAVKSAKNAVVNKVSEWTTVGKNIIEGLKNGIANAAKGVISAAKGVVSDAIEGAKKLLKINSPSKVFMSMGMSIDEGLVVGINKMASSVTSTTKKVGRGAIGAMSDTLSNLGNIANSVLNGETQPTIRPVLDLSNIESGAGAINGMFGMTPSVGLLSRVGSLSSMMNGYGQNGGNDDVVSAINKLRKDLGNVGGNVTNINGITYNDDGPINDAIGALVRAVMIEGRV